MEDLKTRWFLRFLPEALDPAADRCRQMQPMANVQLEIETRNLCIPTELLSNDFSHLNVGCKFILQIETQMQC